MLKITPAQKKYATALPVVAVVINISYALNIIWFSHSVSVISLVGLAFLCYLGWNVHVHHPLQYDKETPCLLYVPASDLQKTSKNSHARFILIGGDGHLDFNDFCCLLSVENLK